MLHGRLFCLSHYDQFTFITRRFFSCGRSNADELVLELVNLALLEERDELLDLLV